MLLVVLFLRCAVAPGIDYSTFRGICADLFGVRNPSRDALADGVPATRSELPEMTIKTRGELAMEGLQRNVLRILPNNAALGRADYTFVGRDNALQGHAYKLHRVLGIGSFAVVYHASVITAPRSIESRANYGVAIKVSFLREAGLATEAERMWSLRGRQLVPDIFHAARIGSRNGIFDCHGKHVWWRSTKPATWRYSPSFTEEALSHVLRPT